MLFHNKSRGAAGTYTARAQTDITLESANYEELQLWAMGTDVEFEHGERHSFTNNSS
jgi:hypothetical protein